MKILFVVYGLGIGGIEKCLVNLINALPQDHYDVDILLMNPEYALKPEITVKCNFLDSFKYVMNTTDTMQAIKAHGGIIRNFGRFLKYCAFRLAVKFRRSPWKLFDPLLKEYDVAVAYSQNDYSPYYVIDKVNAKRKVLWYHNGAYERAEKEYSRDIRYYSQFDYVVGVSTDCARMLQEKFDFLKDKLIVLKNVCDVDAVRRKAIEFVPQSFATKQFHLVTVGRMTKEKGANIAVEVCKELIEKKYPICWHWVGDGNQRVTIEKLIRKRKLESYFILEGNQDNPYPYINNAEIYVQPSYYEAYSTTVTEAKVLCKPIVTTDVGGMRDQIEDGVTGWIMPISTQAFVKKIEELIQEPALLKACQAKLKKTSAENNSLQEYENTVFSELI